MMPRHHPGEDLLWDYVAGSMREPVALAVATHLAYCPVCRAEVGRLEAVAGALFEDVGPEAGDVDLLAGAMARLDRAEDPPPTTPPTPLDEDKQYNIPRPLRDYLQVPVERLDWHERRFGPSYVRLLTDQPFDTRLLRIRAGATMPLHTHGGNEYTLVLAGGFVDGTSRFGPGDFCAADAAISHQPVADADEDCLCLAVVDAPLRLSGPFGRLLNPFVKY